MIGQTINGYNITQEIGKGGMAIVYKGENLNSLIEYKAFKVVRPDKGENNHKLYRCFLKEIHITSELREHEGIVKVIDVHPHNNTTVLEMEFLNGLNLDQYIRQNAPNGIENETLLTKICIKILEALQYAHDRNILHLDVKPNNIFRTHTGRIKLLDFGIAKVVGEKAGIIEGAEALTALTETGESTFKGTLAYSSPEQQAGVEVTHASDIFSFGKTLHFISTGSTDMNVECQLEPFATIIDKCTQQKIKFRYSSCREIMDYLNNSSFSSNSKIKCIGCNNEIDGGTMFCPSCGKIQKTQKSPKNEHKDCPSCGAKDNALDSRFCHVCGHSFEKRPNPPKPQKKTCPKGCGGTYELVDNFCNDCGSRLIVKI